MKILVVHVEKVCTVMIGYYFWVISYFYLAMHMNLHYHKRGQLINCKNKIIIQNCFFSLNGDVMFQNENSR